MFDLWKIRNLLIGNYLFEDLSPDVTEIIIWGQNSVFVIRNMVILLHSPKALILTKLLFWNYDKILIDFNGWECTFPD